jgi:hypothetical protein
VENPNRERRRPTSLFGYKNHGFAEGAALPSEPKFEVNLNDSLVFRLLKVTVGWVLIVVGAGLFVIFTSTINYAHAMGGPMNFHPLAQLTLWPVVLVLDLVFLSLVFGGVKLAGFSRRIFGLILVVAGIGILSLGIWNHVTGPSVDYDSTLPERTRMPVAPELNHIVYFWSSVTILGGLLLTIFGNRPPEIESSEVG